MAKPRGQLQRWTGWTLTGIFLVAALLGPWLSPHPPMKQEVGDRLSQPSTEFWLGTDGLGRDVFSRILHGAQVSLLIAAGAILFALIISIPSGLLIGCYGGWTDSIAMRLIDILLAFPSILLAIVLMVALDPAQLDISSDAQNMLRFFLLTGVIGLVNVPTMTSVIRSSVMVEREKDYVIASRALGAGTLRVAFGRILPNILGPIIVLATLGIGTAILETAGLGFLGLGPQPDSPEWGTALNQARSYLRQAPWVAYAPGLAIVAAVLGFNLLGDRLRDKLDPRTQRQG